MKYPNNRLIVNGVDLSEKFKMVLVDGYTLKPPAPKTYTVDIPGGNGKLDLTESLLGDTVYDNRKQEFTFYVIDVNEFEKVKTEVSNFLHGKAYDYQITMDPEYTYHGRFTVDSYAHKTYSSGNTGTFKITVESDPFKIKEQQVFRIDAIGGATIKLESGRMRVRPIVNTDTFTTVIYDGEQLYLKKGSWAINDLLLKEGSNYVYFNTFPIHNLKWVDLKDNVVTWSKFKEDPLYEWYKSNGDGTYVIKKWEHWTGKTWADIESQTWAENMYEAEETNVIKNVYIKYDWGDL